MAVDDRQDIISLDFSKNEESLTSIEGTFDSVPENPIFEDLTLVNEEAAENISDVAEDVDAIEQHTWSIDSSSSQTRDYTRDSVTELKNIFEQVDGLHDWIDESLNKDELPAINSPVVGSSSFYNGHSQDYSGSQEFLNSGKEDREEQTTVIKTISEQINRESLERKEHEKRFGLPFRRMIEKSLGWIREGFNGILSGLNKTTGVSIWTAVGFIGAAIVDKLIQWWPHISAVVDKTKELWEKIPGIWSNFMQWYDSSPLKKVVDTLTEGLKGYLTNAWENIKKIFDPDLSVGQKVKAFFRAVLGKRLGNWLFGDESPEAMDELESEDAFTRNKYKRLFEAFGHIEQGTGKIYDQSGQAVEETSFGVSSEKTYYNIEQALMKAGFEDKIQRGKFGEITNLKDIVQSLGLMANKDYTQADVYDRLMQAQTQRGDNWLVPWQSTDMAQKWVYDKNGNLLPVMEEKDALYRTGDYVGNKGNKKSAEATKIQQAGYGAASEGLPFFAPVGNWIKKNVWDPINQPVASQTQSVENEFNQMMEPVKDLNRPIANPTIAETVIMYKNDPQMATVGGQ